MGWTFSLSRTTLPFSIRPTSSEMYVVDDKSSAIEPAEGFGVFVSPSPLDEGEGMSSSLLGGAGKAAGGFTTGVEFVLVEATESTERSLFSAVAKASSAPLESGTDPTEEIVAGADLEASIRGGTESTMFLF